MQEAPLPAGLLHLLKSRTEAIKPVQQIFTYSAVEKGQR